MYTSGTTGFPKGVLHNHNLIRNVEERAYRLGVTENDVIMNYLPLFHAFGYSEGSLLSMVSGARHVITETFDPDEVLDLVERERGTMANGFDTHVQGLCDAQEARPRDVSSLRTGLFGAGMHNSTPVIRRSFRLLKPMHAVSGYGMTEVWVGAMLGALDDDEDHRAETSGYPAPGYDIRVVDPDTGREQPDGVPGEIRVRGYCLMLGYYKKPKETAESYQDGWFCTGDMGERRADGYIRFIGRYKDMLKVGGENVDPMEVEGFLLEHPAVQQVAVVGVADRRLAEVPVAFVECKPGAEVDEDAVIAYCRGKVASFKIPRHVVFVDAFPMTASGKIRKVDLRAAGVGTVPNPIEMSVELLEADWSEPGKVRVVSTTRGSGDPHGELDLGRAATARNGLHGTARACTRPSASPTCSGSARCTGPAFTMPRASAPRWRRTPSGPTFPGWRSR